jgi:hypothetical protein
VRPITAVLEDPIFDVGAWLVEERRRADINEAAWLEVLAEFDRSERWLLDGQLTGADWLRWRMKMARSTAHEKLQVAHELERRPIVKAAFAAGEICYSAVRAITRLEGVSPAVDETLVELARRGSVLQLEQAVRFYRLHDEQDRPIDPRGGRDTRRGIHISYGLNGLGTVEMTLTDVEIKEFATGLQAFAESNPVNARADLLTGDPGGVGGFVPAWQRRADSFMEMVRVALAHAQGGHAMGADRYQLHVVTDVAGTHPRLIDGTPIDRTTLERIACDCSIVGHVVNGGEVLSLGRKTRDWNTPQRRAITVRDGGRCRFPGCERRLGDLHHLKWWTKDGPTDIDNGLYMCGRHHDLIHKRAFSAHGDANHEVKFLRPDGSLVGTTSPPRPDLRLFSA